MLFALVIIFCLFSYSALWNLHLLFTVFVFLKQIVRKFASYMNQRSVILASKVLLKFHEIFKMLIFTEI